MGYNPKLNWKADDPVTEHDLTRIERGIDDAHKGLGNIEQGVGQDFGQLQEEVAAHKENYAKFKEETKYNFTQGLDRPLHSTESKIFFVSSNGNDNNDGLTKETGFATLSRCIREIPLNLNHTYIIRVDNKLVSNEEFYLENVSGFGSLHFSTFGDNGIPKLSKMSFKGVFCKLQVGFFELTSTTDYKISFLYCGYTRVVNNYFNTFKQDMNYPAMLAEGSQTFIELTQNHCNNQLRFFELREGARLYNTSTNYGNNNKYIASLLFGSIWYKERRYALPEYTLAETAHTSPPGAVIEVGSQ